MARRVLNPTWVREALVIDPKRVLHNGQRHREAQAQSARRGRQRRQLPMGEGDRPTSFALTSAFVALQ